MSSGSESRSGPLPIFDHHLKALGESYIQFFQERARIEEVYSISSVDSLRRLHSKHRALDSYRDDRSSRVTSVRKAWREIGDNAERETQTREAFLENLKSEVLNPLFTLKETQERTRKRIKEDLKNSTEAHVEFAEHTLPRLKRNYYRKCQELEDHKSDKYTLTSSMLASEDDHPLTKVTSNPVAIGLPTAIRPPARYPSIQQPSTGRNRSPSSSTAFSDLAHQGKKQLNSLMTFLNESGKSGVPREGPGGRAESALRGVKARRDADEADKEYRQGVHRLETLRLMRVKTLEGGYKSSESFILESAETLKRILMKYADCLIATSTTITQLTNHLEPMISAISPSGDVTTLAPKLRRAMARDIPKPILYHNYTVGECRHLIFGVPLVEYAVAHNLPEGAVPKIVDLCVKEVEARGMDTEGIYRVSGRHANVQELKYKIERDEKSFQFNPVTDDVSCVASMLKLYLRELPEPVFKFPLTERLQHSGEREEHVANNFPVLRSKLRRLPPVHQATLRCLVEHLARIGSRSQFNKMDAKNLAIVFGGVIFGEEELPKGSDILSIQTWKDTVMEDLITHAPLLFEDGTMPTPHESPLPPAPSGEAKPKYDYGSSYTRSHTIPPRSQDGQDFMPTLPPRPGKSIHPSRRTNLQSSISDEYDQASVSSTPTQHLDEGQSPDSQPRTLESDIPTIPSIVTNPQDESDSRSEHEEIPIDLETLTDDTATSSTWGSRQLRRTSKVISRPSTAGSLSPGVRASHDSG